MVQAPTTRSSSGAGCNSWVSGRLDDQRCLRTRLLLTNVPEAWAKAQRPRQVQWARHTRQVTVLKPSRPFSLISLGKNLPAQLSSAVVHR